MSKTFELKAIDFIPENGSVIDTAEAAAACINAHLDQGESVDVAMTGMTGVTSSFFNLVIRRVAEKFGFEVFENRVKFRFSSTIQQQTFDRSFSATRKYLESLPSHSS
jgi:hypothetical protein